MSEHSNFFIGGLPRPLASFRKRSIFIFCVFVSALFIAGISWGVWEKDKKSLGASQPQSRPRMLARSIEFTERITVPVPNGSKNLKIWIPVPTNDSYQYAEILNVESLYSYRITKDKDFRNHLLYIEPKLPIKDQNIKIKVLYKIVRKEQRVLDAMSNNESTDIQTPSFLISDYLKPRGLEAINEKIKGISEEITRGINDPFQKAKVIYAYVLRHMKYDKSGIDWGRGDSVYACDIGKGNCTDFHSLFITLARASQIPARFQMGIPLPESSEGEPSGNYHCWAEFYMDGKGWIPVDISEAWKNPQKAEYFFGNLDVNRILLTTGREILLSPQQKGGALNYLSRPYIELDGQPLNNFKLERRFKDI